VLNCFNPSTWNKDDNRRVITIVTDRGYQVDYSSVYFEKTDNQLKKERREDLLNNLGL
jgi:hypothetical protein